MNEPLTDDDLELIEYTVAVTAPPKHAFFLTAVRRLIAEIRLLREGNAVAVRPVEKGTNE